MILNNNSSFSKEAFKNHYYNFSKYKYKLRLEYITPEHSDRNTNWRLIIEGKTNENGISINKIGYMTDESILDTLINNLEGYCNISNSKPLATKIITDLKELTIRYSVK